MKIINLQVENLKRVRAVEITPDGNTVLITGRNGQGKSSVLDAIWYALGGKRAERDTPRPVRDGQQRAQVTVDLGDLRVTRTWTTTGPGSLKVENADGAQYRSPQRMLDDLVGRLSFDPLEFASEPDRDQLATLLELVELPFDPEQLDAERRDLYDERTAVGREVRQLQGQLDGMPLPPPGLPAEEQSAQQLIDRIQTAQDLHTQADDLDESITSLRSEIDDLEQRLATARHELGQAEQARAELADPEDVDALRRQLGSVEELNAQVREARQREQVNQRLQQTRNRYEALSRQIADVDDRKEQGLREARMPIPGLGFDDNGVTYNGVPFKQCSSAEQLRVSLAMAMALNPQLRVIRITDGSLLDSDSLRLISEMADEHDFQVWVERVDESGEVGVYIEDGMVAEPAAGVAS